MGEPSPLSTAPSPLRVGAVVFDDFELLDLFGPLEMFGLLEKEAAVTLLAREKGPVKSSAGVRVVADEPLADVAGFDLLLLPGGLGTRLLARDAAFLREIRRLADSSGHVASVCTGSLLFAAAGLLDGRRATTNKRVFPVISSAFPKVLWQGRARWVVDGKFVTASGISAGTDMALALISGRFGRERALEIAKRAEYRWSENPADDPFAVE